MTSVSEVDWKIAPSCTSLARKRARIGEIAVVGDGDAAAGQIGEQRLDVAHRRAARRRIAVVADGEGAFQVGRVRAVLAEDVADQAGMALGDELALVVGDDAGGFLAAMLQRVQAEHGQRARVGMAENAEYAALLVQRIAVKFEIGRSGRSWLAASAATRCFDEPV